MAADRAVGRLLLTGVPGWLTDALLRSFQLEPLVGLVSIRCLVQPGQPIKAAGDSRVPVDYVVGDLQDSASLGRATQGIDTVFHAAGVLHVRRTREFYEVNTRGTARLLDAAIQAHVGRFVHVSSNAAAGRSDSRDHLLSESDPARPLSHYGRSKRLAEEIVLGGSQRLEAVVIRPCMFYGPPVPARHVDVYRRVASGRMPLVGSGDYARSLSYIDDLVQGSRLALARTVAAGQVYYISDARPYTTREVVEAMASALGVRPRFIRVPRVIAPLAYTTDTALARLDVYWQTLHLVGEADWHVGVSSAKAQQELGYQPTVELYEGMRRAIGWCKADGKLDQVGTVAAELRASESV